MKIELVSLSRHVSQKPSKIAFLNHFMSLRFCPKTQKAAAVLAFTAALPPLKTSHAV
jgi:hypothetical protein